MLKVAFMIITILICFGMPITWFLVLCHRKKSYFGVLVGGGLSFYFFQMILRMPLIQLLLPRFDWYMKLSENTIGIAVFLGLTAAVFETAGRSLTLNVLLKSRISYRTGLIHGIGHGGIEAIMLVGINYIFYAVYTFLYVRGVEQPMLFMFPTEIQGLMHTQVLDADTVLFLVAGLERAMTMVFHVAMSLLITVGILKQRQILYTVLVVALHALLDFLAVIMSVSALNYWLIEGMIFIFVLLSVGIILYYRSSVKKDSDQDEGESAVDQGF